MSHVTAARLKELVDAGSDLHLIDVLPRASFERRRLPGALNVSFYDDGFAERVEAAVGDRDATVVVYCASASCNASARAAEALRAAGFASVLDFEGGVREWEQAGYPVAGSRGGRR